MLYFFPRIILNDFFINFTHLWWFGVLVCVLLGLGFQLMGFGACGVGPSGLFGWGFSSLYINIKY